jgi:hypothetical protein
MANQRGFVPCRKLGGGPATTRMFPVSAVANEAYFLGDAVIMSTTGKVRPLKAGTPLATRPLGVIVGMLDSNQRPLTHSLPTRGPFLASGVAGYAFVNCDPNQTYVAEFGGNVNDAVTFAGVKVSAGAPNTATGLSGQGLDGTAITTADAQFRVLGLAPEQFVTNPRGAATASAASALVEVMIVNPALGGGGQII